MVLTTAIELVGGWTLFKIYHIRWWDYSNMKFNIGGYICPQFSLLWGAGQCHHGQGGAPGAGQGQQPAAHEGAGACRAAVLALFVVDLIVSRSRRHRPEQQKLKEIDEVRATCVTSDKLTTVLGVSAMTADTIWTSKSCSWPWPAGGPRERRRVEAGNAAACQRNARQAA